jgi:H+/Cl- antiporter ClcA
MSNKSTSLTWKREEPISVPVAGQERRIAIRYLDWDRCKRKLNKIRQQVPRLHLVYSFLFGITATSGFSLITFYTNPETKLPAWGYPLYLLAFLFSLAAAICFVYVDRKIWQQKESDIDDIIEDMESIEKTFPNVQ